MYYLRFYFIVFLHPHIKSLDCFVRTGVFQIEGDVDKHFVSLFGRFVFNSGGGDLRSASNTVDCTVHIKGFFVTCQFVEVEVSVMTRNRVTSLNAFTIASRTEGAYSSCWVVLLPVTAVVARSVRMLPTVCFLFCALST